MVIGAFVAGFGATWLLTHGSTASADEAAEFGVFWEAWHLIENQFFGDLPDMQHVTWGAIRGAIGTIKNRKINDAVIVFPAMVFLSEIQSILLTS